ncbi:MAG: hypothetical protein ACRD0U_00610, partial [Acidimicrobiales bacterium]
GVRFLLPRSFDGCGRRGGGVAARREPIQRDAPDREAEDSSGQPRIGCGVGAILGLQRRAGNHAVQRMLDARGERVQRAILDPTYEDEVFEVEEAKRRAKLADAAGGRIAANDPRKAALQTSAALSTRLPYAPPAQAAPGRLAAADPRKATTQSALVTSGLLPAPARPAPPAPGKLAAADPRNAMVEANLPLRAGVPQTLENLAKKREADEQKAREEAKAKEYSSFLASVGVEPPKHTEYFLKQIAHHYGRWAKAAAIANPDAYQKNETKEYKADLDNFLKLNLERDKKEKDTQEKTAEYEQQRKEYATRFEAMLAIVPKNTSAPAPVIALLEAVKAEIDTISSKSGNVSSNFGSDLQATASGAHSPGVVAMAGDAWSLGLYRFVKGDQAYRGPTKKGRRARRLPARTSPRPTSRPRSGKRRRARSTSTSTSGSRRETKTSMSTGTTWARHRRKRASLSARSSAWPGTTPTTSIHSV